jgi:hypothetical protein
MESKVTDSTDDRGRPKYKFPTAERFRLSPRTDQELDLLTSDLLLWAEQDDSITFGGFIEVSGLYNARLYEYAKRHQGLADAIIVARQLVGNRREKRGLENKYNSAIVLGTMPLYDPEIRAYKKELAQKDTEYGSAKIIVHMDSFPETKDVPVKKQEQDEV